jgi:hypothetical protein
MPKGADELDELYWRKVVHQLLVGHDQEPAALLVQPEANILRHHVGIRPVTIIQAPNKPPEPEILWRSCLMAPLANHAAAVGRFRFARIGMRFA